MHRSTARFAPLAFAAAALLLLALGPMTALADCVPHGRLSAWPLPQHHIPVEPLLMLEGEWEKSAVVKALAEGSRATLVARGHRVPLKVASLHHGLKASWVFLRPATPLRPDTRYRLDLRDADGKRVRTPGPFGKKPIAWTTRAGTDGAAPMAVPDPARITQRTHDRGCPAAATIGFRIHPQTEWSALARMQFTDEATHRTWTVVRPIYGDRVWAGFNECGSDFPALGSERTWRADLTVVDAAGHVVHLLEPLVFAGIARGENQRDL